MSPLAEQLQASIDHETAKRADAIRSTARQIDHAIMNLASVVEQVRIARDRAVKAECDDELLAMIMDVRELLDKGLAGLSTIEYFVWRSMPPPDLVQVASAELMRETCARR